MALATNSNNGYKQRNTLEKYYVDNGAATGVTKANVPGDPDYVAPIYDPTSCPIPQFTNTAIGGTFTRDNCGAGYTGGQQTYVINAGVFSSSISQADADQQALADINAWGQHHVNVGSTNALGGYGNVPIQGSCTLNAPSSYLLDVRLENLDVNSACSKPLASVYTTSSVLTPGHILYNDSALTSVVTGYVFVVSAVSGSIYNMNNTTGEVGLYTGNDCVV